MITVRINQKVHLNKIRQKISLSIKCLKCANTHQDAHQVTLSPAKTVERPSASNATDPSKLGTLQLQETQLNVVIVKGTLNDHSYLFNFY